MNERGIKGESLASRGGISELRLSSHFWGNRRTNSHKFGCERVRRNHVRKGMKY